MAKYTVSLDPHLANNAVKTALSPPPWPGLPLDEWLARGRGADWAAAWLTKLSRLYGDELPHLMQRGLQGTEVPMWMTAGSPEPQWLHAYLAQTSQSRKWFEGGFLSDDPTWLVRLLRYEKANVARSFLLTGNVSDYAFDPVVGYRPAIRVLVDALLRVKDCVLLFRLSQGLTLECHDIEETKRKLPRDIQEELETGGYSAAEPIASRVCRIFSILRRWLAGAGASAQDVNTGSFAKGVAIVFENVHLIIPADRADMERNFLVDNLLEWSNSPQLFRSSHCLVLMAEALEDVSDDLRAQGGKIEQIAIARPDTVSSRLKFLMPLLDPGSKMTQTRVGAMPAPQRWLSSYGQARGFDEALLLLANDTAGLSFIGIEDLLQQASATESQGLRRDQVMRMKRERLQQESGGMLEVVDPQRTLDDIGGYDRLKQRIQELIDGFGSISDSLHRAAMPMGVLFLGPPGTGKSVMAEALAGASGVNMAKLGDFRGKYVGESERNLSRVFGLIESLHPVIVFIDEVDQALGRRGGGTEDGGVDRRIFGRFLEFMSIGAHRGQILWVGAANYPDKIDEAFKRPGRFDLVLPFTVPDAAGRADILAKLLRSRLKGMEGVTVHIPDEALRRLSLAMETFTGAEIESVVGEALRRLAGQRARDAEAAQVTVPLLESVLAAYVPKEKSKYVEMENLALREVSFLDLVDDGLADRIRKLRHG